MSKYDSPYFNNERYYDPTAGAVLCRIIKEEKQKYSRVKLLYVETASNPLLEFSNIFAKYYANFGPRKNGKPKRFAQTKNVLKLLKIYQYCMDHVDDADFSVENTVATLKLGTDRQVRQVFSGNGQISKLIYCYKEWLETGKFEWPKKEVS